MKRIKRISELDNLLKYPKGYTILDLMSKLDVAERTLRKDLEQIQKPPYNAIFWNEYRGKERLYRYADVNYSLPLFEDKNEVKKKLNEAINVIEHYKVTPQFQWLKICLLALENDSVDGISNVMSFDNNAYLEGIKHIEAITDAIINKYPIKLTYKPYNSVDKELYVHPYHLKQFNNRWFLIGMLESINYLHVYAIDRILSIEHLSKPYIETDVDFDEYFDDVIGVTVNDVPIQRIELMVNRKRYPYIKTKPLHWSQKHIKEKDSEIEICISIEVKPNKELLSLLFSFGSDIRVVSPESLRKEMREKVVELYNLYN